ncbi:putative glutathione S-transferase [Daldinia decipiens]|uniref:putative glutathione S-transferase n=1 Tax=Daldinia decipiens TaxID=326647 RepID=UPI0020C30103|nr:putative glutathione S-transferase [Daldinia decipiens]KAI1660773.1 putative glutathione S-transferase [Daldinia decipiens]
MVTQSINASPDITIFRGFRDTKNHVWSPYVNKLEARLRFAGVRYEIGVGSPKTAPRGKIPYIECRDLSTTSSSGKGEGSQPKVQLGDSTLITKTLTEWGVLTDLSRALDPSKRLQDMALIALLENKLSFYQTWERWVQNYYTMRDHVLWPIPYPIRIVVGLLAYRANTTMLNGQGTGRFTKEEIEQSMYEIWGAINVQLVMSRSSSKGGDEKPFWVLGGEEPTEADACLFGFIVSAWICTAGPKSHDTIKSFPVLLDYAGRIHDQYFPDYDKWTVQ